MNPNLMQLIEIEIEKRAVKECRDFYNDDTLDVNALSVKMKIEEMKQDYAESTVREFLR